MSLLGSHNSFVRELGHWHSWHEMTRKHGHVQGVLVLALCLRDTHLAASHAQLAKEGLYGSLASPSQPISIVLREWNTLVDNGGVCVSLYLQC